MIAPTDQFEELADLAWAAVNDRLDAAGADRLQQLLDADAANRRSYIELMDQFASLEWEMSEGGRRGVEGGRGMGSLPPIEAGGDEGSGFRVQGSGAITDVLPVPFSPSPIPPLILSSFSTLPSFVGSALFSYMIATVIMGAVLAVASVWKLPRDSQLARQTTPPAIQQRSQVEPKREFVGRITGMVDCRWVQGSGFRVQGSEAENQKSEIGNQKSLVARGDSFILTSGLMEISYDSGAKVILQGPVTYEVDSAAGGYLSLGKLTARLEKSEIRNPNSETISKSPNLQVSKFFVRTPTAIVTDLGTEFGVEVSKEGHTTSHVFRGSIELRAIAGSGAANGSAEVLHEHQSARVETGRDGGDGGVRIVVAQLPAEAARFVREIARPTIKTLDLIDVVAGGNGFSGRRDRGIDPTNGEIRSSRGKPALQVKDYVVGDRQYHRVRALPGVDGVFIPDGSAGPMPVDSAGHVSDAFPPTSNQTDGYVWVGGVVHTDPPFRDIRTVLDGIDFASAGHGILYLQSNQGITFDLDALRRANPGHRMVRFRATAGNVEPVSAEGQSVYADLWVLVDGQVGFRRREISGLNGAFRIAVPLHDDNHFLTLASTDGGNGIGWDQIIFGDPRLELTPVGADHPRNQRLENNVEK